jgi:hypothetical protein
MKTKDIIFTDTKGADWETVPASLIDVNKRSEHFTLNSGAPLFLQPDNLQLELIDVGEL